MDDSQFDRLARSLSMTRSRRTAAGLVGALAAFPLLQSVPGEAGKRKKGKKGKGKGNGKKQPPAAPPPTTTPRPCSVRSTDNLQEAIDAAPAGSTLTLCAGTWNVVSTLTIKKNLTIIGGGPDQTILDGGDKVRVLSIAQNSIVTLQDLTITRGSTVPEPMRSDVYGGGIKTYKANVTLRNVTVSNSASGFGGGIFHQAGTLVLAAGTRVTGNTAIHRRFLVENTGVGGGIFVMEDGVVRLESGSSVTNNAATNIDAPQLARGGGIHYSSGSLTIDPGSVVSGNTPDNCDPDKGSCI